MSSARLRELRRLRRLTCAAAFVLAALLGATTAAAAAKPAPRRPEAANSIDSAAVLSLLDGVLNRACPLPGLITGGQPSVAHLDALARSGYHTVLDLRTPDEPRGFDEPAAMRAAGLHYVELPLTSATLVDSTFDAFRGAMRAAGPRGVFVHCASGNRVGAVMIPWLVLDRGWKLQRAIAAAKLGGLRSTELEEKARAYLARQPEAPRRGRR